jgi:hypothetical protein
MTKWKRFLDALPIVGLAMLGALYVNGLEAVPGWGRWFTIAVMWVGATLAVIDPVPWWTVGRFKRAASE